MSGEFGPWIERDPGPCPCLGEMVEVAGSCGCGARETTVARDTCDWRGSELLRCRGCGDVGYLFIARYRIRKPRDITILEEQLRDLPVEVDA